MVMLVGGIPGRGTIERQAWDRAKARGSKALDEYAASIGIELDGRYTPENMERMARGLAPEGQSDEEFEEAAEAAALNFDAETIAAVAASFEQTDE